MPQLWEKHYLTDITGQIEHAGIGDVELPFMCIFFLMRMYARDFFFCGSLRCATCFGVDVHDKKMLKKYIRGFTYIRAYTEVTSQHH